MSNPSQVESDAALARRLQEEEFQYLGSMNEGGPAYGGFNSSPDSSSMDIDSDVPPLVDSRSADAHNNASRQHGPRGVPSQNNNPQYPYPFARGGPEVDSQAMMSELVRQIVRGRGFFDTRPSLRSDTLAGLPGYQYMDGPSQRDRSAPPPGNGGRNRTGQPPGLLMAVQQALSSFGQGGILGGVRSGSFMIGSDGTVGFEADIRDSGGGTNGRPNANMPRGNVRGGPNGPGNANFPLDMVSLIMSDFMNRGWNADNAGEQDQLFSFLRSIISGIPVGGEGNETYEDWLNLIERMGGNVNRSATDSEIENLPTRKINKQMLEKRKSARESRAGPSSASGNSSTDTAENDKCAVCLGEYEDGEEVKHLPCTHMFHAECIDRWLKVNRICPVCKQSIRSSDGQSD